MTDINQIQKNFDEMTIAINDLEEEFEDQGSEIETVARDNIAEDVVKIIRFFKIDMDPEQAIGLRDW